MAYKRVNEDSLTAVADAIRSKTGGTNELVFPEEFVSEIQGITTGSEPDLGEKTITANGTYAAASDGLDGYSSVTVAVDTTPSLTDLVVTPSEQLQTFAPGDGHDGFGSVTVGAIQTEEIAIRSNGTYTPTEGKYFSEVVVDIASGVDFGESESYTFASRSPLQTGYTTSYTFATSISVVDGEITLVGATTSTPSTLAHYQGYTGHYFQKSGVTYYIPEDSTFREVINSPDYGYTTVRASVQVVTVAGSGGSDAVLGEKTITSNGTYSASSDGYDGYSSVTVNVKSGGSGAVIGQATTTPSSTGSNIAFTGLSGEPKMFALNMTGGFTLSSLQYITSLIYDGDTYTSTIASSSSSSNGSGYSYTYSGGMLTIKASAYLGGNFRAGSTYTLVYAL